MRGSKVSATLIGIYLVTAMASVPAHADSGTHCIATLVPSSPASSSGVITATAVPGGCFGTEAEAIYAGTGGAVTISSNVTAADLTQSILDAGGASSQTTDFLLGTEFYGLSFGGTSVDYFASTGCGSNTWVVNYVGDGDNDQFSSGKGFSSCDTNKKFEHKTLGGAVLTCTPNCGNYGVLSNEVSSLKWHN